MIGITLTLHSQKLDSDGMFSLRAFLGDIPLKDLLVISKMIEEEKNERINTIYSLYFK